jgi:AAA15 family ATPase/GTPase
MLVEFSVENHRSFKDKVTFSMLAYVSTMLITSYIYLLRFYGTSKNLLIFIIGFDV